MDHSGHGHGGSSHSDPSMTDSSGSSSSSSSSTDHGMQMVFFESQSTPLYSEAWAPSSTGAYAGTCIFLIVLAIVARALIAFKFLLEKRWLRATEHHQQQQTPDSEGEAKDPEAAMGTKVRALHAAGVPPVLPWKFSTDIPRALLVMVIVGIGYLLMLAVMTMNVGYFLSVLAGVFVGDLAVGRFIHVSVEH